MDKMILRELLALVILISAIAVVVYLQYIIHSKLCKRKRNNSKSPTAEDDNENDFGSPYVADQFLSSPRRASGELSSTSFWLNK